MIRGNADICIYYSFHIPNLSSNLNSNQTQPFPNQIQALKLWIQRFTNQIKQLESIIKAVVILIIDIQSIL